eukprot:jgi/Botrbrau1/17633/Bobra.0166s0064.1
MYWSGSPQAQLGWVAWRPHHVLLLCFESFEGLNKVALKGIDKRVCNLPPGGGGGVFHPACFSVLWINEAEKEIPASLGGSIRLASLGPHRLFLDAICQAWWGTPLARPASRAGCANVSIAGLAMCARHTCAYA